MIPKMKVNIRFFYESTNDAQYRLADPGTVLLAAVMKPPNLSVTETAGLLGVNRKRYPNSSTEMQKEHVPCQQARIMFFLCYSVNSLRYTSSPAREIRDRNSSVVHRPASLASPVFGT